MARYKVQLEYQGTRYRGWQVQKNARTVQGELITAFRKVTGQDDLELYGGGRTDAGVHALRQTAHLELRGLPDPGKLRRQVNDELPKDIHLLRIEEAPVRFHARHHAVARSYLYQISRRKTAFGKQLVWWVREELDLESMKRAAPLFTGMKDFRSFAADEPQAKSTRVLIERLQLAEAGSLVLIRIEGSHFLWRMVRRIVGVLVEVGKGSLSRRDVEGFLAAPSDRPARLTAPAAGLFLERVYYEGEPRLSELRPLILIDNC